MSNVEIIDMAPVVLFTYNRLAHTRQTIEALQRNIYAEDTDLFIYSDAPKNENAIESVRMVREYLHGVTGFKSVKIIERAENWGLARNIIDGVTKIVNEYGKIIVLEDDIVTSKYFLKFMNESLTFYKDYKDVMEVSGYMHPIDTSGLPEIYFIQESFCWGWGTWKDSWQFFERNPQKLIKSFSKKQIYEFNMDGSSNEWNEVLLNATGEIHTWAVFWGAAMFLQKGLCVVSTIPLSQNIGFDGSGEHCGNDKTFVVPVKNVEPQIYPRDEEVCENIEARKRIKEFFLNRRPNKIKMILIKLKNILRRVK